MSAIFETSRDIVALLSILRDFVAQPVFQALPVYQGAVWDQRHQHHYPHSILRTR